MSRIKIGRSKMSRNKIGSSIMSRSKLGRTRCAGARWKGII